jgi:transcriptional regulator with XRE-family HTH domain
MGRKSPDPTDLYVGQRVRMRRLELHMTQTGLANALKVTFQQVQKYEKGSNRTSASKLQQIAHVLKVPPSYFFDGGPLSKANGNIVSAANNGMTAATAFLATTDGAKVAQWLPRMQPKDRRAIVALIETLAT